MAGMRARATGEGRAEAVLVVRRADGTVEDPIVVPAALTHELVAATHPSRWTRAKHALVCCWARFCGDLAAALKEE